MINKILSQSYQQFLSIGFGAFCIFSLVNLQTVEKDRLLKKDLSQNIYFKQEESENLKLSFLKKMPAFGFDNLVADGTMLQFLQYFGDGKARDVTGYSLCADYLEVIVKNDPLFSRAYTVISPASSMFAGTPERTIAAMEKGLARMPSDHPDGYWIWLYKGVDEILFMGDLVEAKKSYQMAAKWAEDFGNERIAKSASDTVNFLTTKPDVRQAQASVWFAVLNNNKDMRVRQFAEAKIISLGGKLEMDSDGRVVMTPPQIDKS